MDKEYLVVSNITNVNKKCKKYSNLLWLNYIYLYHDEKDINISLGTIFYYAFYLYFFIFWNLINIGDRHTYVYQYA